MSYQETPAPFAIEDLDRSNKASWARFEGECARLQTLLSVRNLTIDDLGSLLLKIEPEAGAQISEITRSLRETLAYRDQRREYFKNLNSDSLPVAPSRLRRLNRA
jgi:hypothetical protein